QVDLGTSLGITTAGTLLNANLPPGGADLTVVAGMGPGMNVNQFVEEIVLTSDAQTAKLISLMESKLGKSGLTSTEAAHAFEQLDTEAQRPFVLDVFFDTLVQSGRAAANSSPPDFSRGYAAIDALFPQSRSANNPYSGDLSLAFSRIYTLAGGDISLVIPGGELNVGLAVPPPTVTARQPSELGIVAEG